MINKHRINNLKHYTQLWLSETVCSHPTVHCNTNVHREKEKSNLRFGTKSHILCKSTQNTDFFLNPIFGFETEVNVDVKIKVIVLYSKEDMVMNIAQVNERLRQKFNHILQKEKTCHGNWYKLVFKFTPFSLRFIITN